MKLTSETLAKMSEDVFASNPEDKFWATEDGNFFPRERDAIAHAKGQPIEIFERKEQVEEVVTEEELTEIKLPVTDNKVQKPTKK